ncbi:hypothetical protein LQF12_09680 [Ruania suaedae]|uniref:hypothetical protein n=1 Tax=Ruania suaedae TaxID=2897774 RepID=UPI001E55413A|nr:hypothetical protein [Ruania suaedae]UFU04722.1 hypothetical protein LQF12_09680 [Ruania suaedae]
MTQPPPPGTPGDHPPGYGPPAYGQPGYGQPGPGRPGSGPPTGYAGAPHPANRRPGLFDTSFAVSTIATTARPAFIGVILLAGALAFAGLLSAIADFSQLRYGGAVYVLLGLKELVLYGALAFAVLTLGRLLIDHVVQSAAQRRPRAPEGSAGD